MTGRLRPSRSASSLVGDVELLEQLLVGGRLLERVELDPVDVLQQRVAQHRVVGGAAARSPGCAASPARCAARQPALAHDELVASPAATSRTTIGCSSPNSRIECSSSASASSSNDRARLLRVRAGSRRRLDLAVDARRPTGSRRPTAASAHVGRSPARAGRPVEASATTAGSAGSGRRAGARQADRCRRPPVGISAASPRPEPALALGRRVYRPSSRTSGMRRTPRSAISRAASR